jgi:tetratricopeptide (TPR) repeat protein
LTTSNTRSICTRRPATGSGGPTNSATTRGLACCEQALATYRELDDPVGEAETWDSVGYANHNLGDYTQAIACFRHAIDTFRKLGSRRSEADTLVRLGETHRATGATQQTRTCWQQAPAIFEDLEHPDAEAVRSRLRDLCQPAPATAPPMPGDAQERPRSQRAVPDICRWLDFEQALVPTVVVMNSSPLPAR